MRILRTIGIVGSAAVLLFSATAASAQNRPMSAREGMSESGKNPAGIRAALSSTTATTTRREIKKDSYERMQAAREEVQARMKAQHEKTQQRLIEIKDKAKQQMAERLAKQFEKQNSTWTDHFMKVLDRLDAISLKIKDRATIAAGNGKDISTATAAIIAAQTAIANARAAVIAQAAKTYVLDPSALVPTTATTTPSGQEGLVQGLRDSFKNLHNSLFKDLFALRDGPLTDARKAVQNALQTLSKVLGADQGTATTTATSTNQ